MPPCSDLCLWSVVTFHTLYFAPLYLSIFVAAAGDFQELIELLENEYRSGRYSQF